MRVPNQVLDTQSLRIKELLVDFPLEDLWQMPEIKGTHAEFDDVIALVTTANPALDSPAGVRFLWNTRDLLGKWFGLGEITVASIAPPAHSLHHRMPIDLQGTADHISFAALPFVPLYRTETEFAAEIANATMHGIMHLSWLQLDGKHYSPQMAVFVRPNGRLGRAYMQFIKPFRYAIVYPALERQLLQMWERRRPRQ